MAGVVWGCCGGGEWVGPWGAGDGGSGVCGGARWRGGVGGGCWGGWVVGVGGVWRGVLLMKREVLVFFIYVRKSTEDDCRHPSRSRERQ